MIMHLHEYDFFYENCRAYHAKFGRFLASLLTEMEYDDWKAWLIVFESIVYIVDS